MIADNVLDNETITFTYNLNNGWWPDDDFIIITDRPDREAGFTFNLGGATAYIWCLNHVYELLAKGWCHAFIMYNYYYGENTHFMLYTNRYWCGYNLVPGCERFPKIFPFLPVFSINANEGSWLSGQSENPNTTVSGFLEQKEEREIHKPLLNPEEWTAGVDSYNVIGNITIEESPGDAVVLISNRFDGWWGETPGDSGAGAGIVIAIFLVSIFK